MRRWTAICFVIGQYQAARGTPLVGSFGKKMPTKYSQPTKKNNDMNTITRIAAGGSWNLWARPPQKPSRIFSSELQ
jgi:hypothetical protein